MWGSRYDLRAGRYVCSVVRLSGTWAVSMLIRSCLVRLCNISRGWDWVCPRQYPPAYTEYLAWCNLKPRAPSGWAGPRVLRGAQRSVEEAKLQAAGCKHSKKKKLGEPLVSVSDVSLTPYQTT